MADQEKTPKTPQDVDTQAILSRRRFLIASTLAGVGAAVAVAAEGPGVCLSIARPPRPPATEPSTQPATSPTTQPQPCLSPRPPEAEPCLKIVAPDPGPCLSVAEPPDPPTPPQPEPRACLTLKLDK